MQESKFTSEDFIDLKYNPFNGNLFEKYKILNKFPEFKEKITPMLNKDMVIKYVFIMYQESEALSTLDTMAERKMHAALLAGFKIDPDSKRFNSAIEKIISCDDSVVNNMIIRVCQLTRNRLFSKLMKYKEALYKNDQKILEGGQSKEKMKELLDNEEKLDSLIDKTETEYLNKDVSQNLIELLYDNIDDKELGIIPESNAIARAEGRIDQILPNPYIRYE